MNETKTPENKNKNLIHSNLALACKFTTNSVIYFCPTNTFVTTMTHHDLIPSSNYQCMHVFFSIANKRIKSVSHWG